MATSIPGIVIRAATTPTSTLIFLHGLGDSGAGWSSISENFRLRGKFNETTFIFPNAPILPITLNRGMRMPAWFDIISLGDVNRAEDEPGMLNSIRLIHSLITEQVDKGIPSERIVLGGFSQGGALALLAGLTCERKLGGIIALSAWLPLHQKMLAMRTEANKNIPIFQAHGEMDLLVKFAWGEQSKKQLAEMGHNVEWRTFPDLDHSADPEEIAYMEKWLEERFR
ncbi:hypothetical protein RUND412_005700 [Rhizina undulata]